VLQKKQCHTYGFRWYSNAMYLIVCLLLGFSYIFTNYVYATPSSFSVQYFIAETLVDGSLRPANGTYAITLHLISADNPDSPLLSKDYKKTIENGLLNLDIPIPNSIIFKKPQLQTKLLISNLSSDTEETSPEELIVDLYYTTHSKASKASKITQNFSDPQLLQIQYASEQNTSTPSFNVTIGTTNATEKLTVDGSIKAHKFIGDGSKIENISLLRWTKGEKNLYYTNGAVGIGTQTPSPDIALHIASDSNTPTMQVNKTVEITKELQSVFRGTADNISSFNAQQFLTGTVKPSILVGDYPLLDGVGTITSGTWLGRPIAKDYVAKDLTIENSTFLVPNLQGTLNLSSSLSLENLKKPLTIQSQASILSTHASLNSVTLYSTTLNATTFEFSNTLQVSTQNSTNPLLLINNVGQVSLGSSLFTTSFNVNGGVTISSNTQQNFPGLIQYTSDSGFQGFSTKWKTLTKKIGDFTGYSLFPEYSPPIGNPSLSIDTGGHIGIGTQPKNTQDISIAGNIIFLSNLDSPPVSFGASPLQHAFVWGASDGALRVGRNLLSSPLGHGSVALGASTNATSTGSISINFGDTSTSGDYSITLGSGNTDNTPLNNVFDNTVILSSGKTSPPPSASYGNNSVVLSSNSFHLSGTNNIVMSTFLQPQHTSDISTNHSVMFGTPGSNLPTAPIGDHSFIWLSSISDDGRQRSFTFSPPTHSNYDHSFSIYAHMGINSLNNNNDSLFIGGAVSANAYYGVGLMLTNIDAEKLGQIGASLVNSPNSIYISDFNQTYPANIATSATITNNTIESIDIQSFSIVSRNIGAGSITATHLPDNVLDVKHFKVDSLFGDVFSDITSKNFTESPVINHEKLATNSIETIHFTNRVIPQHYLTSNIINSTNMQVNNIALGGVDIIDLKPGILFNSHYLATASIFERHITKNALSNYHITKNAILPFNIANNAITSRHITSNAIVSSNILDKAIESDHFTTDYLAELSSLTNNVFIGRHFDDRVLTLKMLDQVLFKVASNQFSIPAIMANDIATGAVTQTHISDHAITTVHVSSNAIASHNILNGTLTSLDFSNNAITSSNILDRSLSHNNIASASIQGIHFIPGTITANYIATDAVLGLHIGDQQISTLNFMDKSIVARHISDGALTSSKFKPNAIVSRNLSLGVIASTNLQALVITSGINELIATGTITWHHISGDIPTDLLPVITTNKLSIGDASITSKFIQENAITEAKFATDFKISATDLLKLQLPISVDNGGTGLTESDYKKNTILFFTYINTLNYSGYKFGQDKNLMWNTNSLLIGSPNISNDSSLIVSKNIHIQHGGLKIAQQNNPGSFNVMVKDNALQFTTGNLTTSTDGPLLGLKSWRTYANQSLDVGTSSPCISNCSSVNVSGNVVIGSNFISNNISAPSYGLLVEKALNVGDPNNKSGTLNVNNKILVSSTISSPIIVSDITNSPSLITGLRSTDASIKSEGAANTGIRVSGPIGGTVTIPKSSSIVTGIKLSVKDQGTALIVSNNAYLAHTSNGKEYGVYGIAPEITNVSEYAGYFVTGNVHIGRLDMNQMQQPADSALTTSELYFEGGPIGFKPIDVPGNHINWSQSAIAHISIAQSSKTLTFTPPKTSKHLLLKIKYNEFGSGKIGFPSSVTWSSNWANGSNPTPNIQGQPNVEHIVMFYYNKESDRYYARIGFDFDN
jgi:hypothetical protein